MKKIFVALFVALTAHLTEANAQFWNKPKIEEPCNVYWNGKQFKLGKTKDDNNFRQYSYAYYGVEAVIVALPVAMAKELKIDGKVGDQVPMQGSFKRFMDAHWSDISKICKLENIK